MVRLDPRANYHTMEGETYSAIRIPKAETSAARIKRIISAGVADIETLKSLENKALSSIRKFAENKLSLDDTLTAIINYDELLELPRDGKVSMESQQKRVNKHRMMYQKLLEDKPWVKCNCTICQEIGIEAVIFRGNNLFKNLSKNHYYYS